MAEHNEFENGMQMEGTELREKDSDAVLQLREQIALEEKRLTENYCLLGQAYMTAHSSDYEETFSVYVSEILVSQKKKYEYLKKIMDLKGIKLCESCGAEVPENALFCFACGNKMPDSKFVVPDGQTRCRRCGSLQPIGNRFCMNCGQLIEEVISVEDGESKRTAQESAETPTHEEEKEEASFCIHCGSPLEPGDLFCSECGASQREA